jgi:hypothetical protein
MTGTSGQLLSVKSRFKRTLDQQDQERKMRNGNVSMINSTTLSGKPSLPVTRYRLFKSLATAKGSGQDLSRDSRGFRPGKAGILTKPTCDDTFAH